MRFGLRISVEQNPCQDSSKRAKPTHAGRAVSFLLGNKTRYGNAFVKELMIVMKWNVIHSAPLAARLKMGSQLSVSRAASTRGRWGEKQMLIGILLSVSGMALAQSSPSKAITPQATQSRTVADAIPPDADRAAYAASELAHGKLAVRPDTPPLPSKGLTHYLVTLKPDADPHQWDQELSPTHHFSHALKGFRAQLTADQYKKLKNDKQVLAIEPDTAIRPAVVTGAANGQNPTPDSGCICEFEFSNVEELPTGLVRMGVPSFPLAHIDGGDHQLNVNVAVLDTGIDLGYSYADWYNTSPELNVAESIEFTTNVDTNGQPVYYYQGWDSIGHGTHVSGTIGARNNGYGVVGVAPGVTIYNYQVITPTSSAWGNVVQALDHVVANQSPSHNIQVINASLESTGPGAPYFAVSAAVRSVVNLGIVYVNAAGNDGCDIYGANCSWTGSGPTGPGSTNCVLPASVREALVVSAMDPTPTNSTYDTIASYSNYSGSVVDSDPAPDGSPPNPSVPVFLRARPLTWLLPAACAVAFALFTLVAKEPRWGAPAWRQLTFRAWWHFTWPPIPLLQHPMQIGFIAFDKP